MPILRGRPSQARPIKIMFGDVRLSVDSVDRKNTLDVRPALDPTRVVIEMRYSSPRGRAILSSEIELDKRAFLRWVSSIQDGLL